MIWNAVVTSTLSQTQLPGIQSLGYSGKMSEAVASSNIFKGSQPIPSHWVPGMEWKNVGSSRFFQCIQMDPGDLYFQASLSWLHNSVCWLCLLKDSIHSLKNWIDSRSSWGTLLQWKNVGPRTDPANSCGHSNRPRTFIFEIGRASCRERV